MKLEVGMLVKRRDGVKGKVIGRLDDEMGKFHSPWLIQWRGNGHGSCHDENGQHQCSSTLDAVAEWREPRTWKVEVVTVEQIDGSACQYIQPPGFKWVGKVIARKIVTLTEGEGL